MKPITVLDRRSVPSLAPPAELFRALSDVLGRLNVGWYVFGAQAVLHWGRPRFTVDIDVTVQMELTRADALVTAMQRAGFVLTVEGTKAFIEQTRVLPFLHTASQWPLDLVIGGPGLEEEFLRRAVLVEVDPGLEVPVISAEDLVVTKVLAGRPKDLDDVRGIIVAQGDGLDLRAVRVTIGMLEDALGVSDLLPALDSALR